MFLQSLRKVTPGTPADNQIAMYAHGADVFVSGDGALVDILNRVRADAPAPLAVGAKADASVDVVVAIEHAIGAVEAV